MTELIELARESIAFVNAGYTVLFILVLLYWLSVFIGILDVDLFNIDIDADVDMDMDADLDADAEADGGGGLHAFLAYFNIGEVPLMLVLSFAIISMWAIGVLLNYYLNPGHNIFIGLAVLAVNLVVSAYIAKFCAVPFKKIFRALDSDVQQSDNLKGKICRVHTSRVDAGFGQVEISTGGVPLLLNARSYDGVILEKGEEAVIVERRQDDGICLIIKMDLNENK